MTRKLGAIPKISEAERVEQDKKETESTLRSQARLIEEIGRCIEERYKGSNEETRTTKKDTSGSSYTQMNPIGGKRREAKYNLFIEEEEVGFHQPTRDDGKFHYLLTTKTSSQHFCRDRSASMDSSTCS